MNSRLEKFLAECESDVCHEGASAPERRTRRLIEIVRLMDKMIVWRVVGWNEGCLRQLGFSDTCRRKIDDLIGGGAR